MSAGCMGGFCSLRDKCPYYNAGTGSQPLERLCLPQQDGLMVIIGSQGGTVRRHAFPMRADARLVEAEGAEV